MRSKIIYLIKNIGLFTISNFATKLLSFLIVPFYTYYLSTEQYASIDLINTAISLLVPLLTVSDYFSRSTPLIHSLSTTLKYSIHV